MEEQILSAAASILANSVIPIVFTFYINTMLKKTVAVADSRKADEQKKNMILIQSIGALCHTTKALCEAMKNGKINGNIDSSLEKLEELNDKINDFLVEKATRE